MRPQDIFGASPKTVLNKPFFHVQDQKAYNVDGGTSVADAWTKRTLNTVIVNDIQGASLSNDAVNLPAGTYYVEGRFTLGGNTGTVYAGLAGIFKDGTRQHVSLANHCHNSEDRFVVEVSGIVTLSVPGAVDLRYYAGSGGLATALGVSLNSDSIADTTIPSIYADLKIWQLDRSLEIAPKAINAPLTNIAGVLSEGLIDGFDITTSGQVITVGKGACMDSTRAIPMALTSNATWTVAGTPNLEQYLFVVRLKSDNSFTVKGYTTFAGPSSDVLIDYYRFISWAKNNGSGVLMPYRQDGNILCFLTLTTTTAPLVTSTLTATYTLKSLSSLIGSMDIVEGWELLVGSNALAEGLYISFDGVYHYWVGGQYSREPVRLPAVTSIYAKSMNSNDSITISKIYLRR